jgi:hypothetical protein
VEVRLHFGGRLGLQPVNNVKIDSELLPYVGYLAYRKTIVWKYMTETDAKYIYLGSGNREGKTETIVHGEVITPILGNHPIGHRNILPTDRDGGRIIRLASKTLPNDPEGGEIKNTLYPAVKRMLPPNLLKKDITQRKPIMTVKDPKGGPDIFLEFVSYGQDADAMAGVERKKIILDELPPYNFYEEQIPRISTTNGCMVFGITSTEANWAFDELWERARQYIRTPRVRKYLKDTEGKDYPEVENTDSDKDIVVIVAATDDNPIWPSVILVDAIGSWMRQVHDAKVIDWSKANGDAKPILDMLELSQYRRIFPADMKDARARVVDTVEKLKKQYPELSKYPLVIPKIKEFIDKTFIYDDPDTMAMRRYGIMKQSSGAIYKDFQWNIHMIPMSKYFPSGIPHEWKHARLIDYHQTNPWACHFISLSPQDEAFVWQEWAPSPEKLIVMQIARQLAMWSGDYKYTFDLMDPLASENVPMVGRSVMQEMNRLFLEMKREGLCTGAYWKSWDTKSTKGQDEIRKRLKNARICGRPFSNKLVENGKVTILPTLWIADHCKMTAQSLKNWRRDEYRDKNALVNNDQKEKGTQKWSHYCMTIEAAFKHPAFTPPNPDAHPMDRSPVQKNYGQVGFYRGYAR